MQWLIAKSIRWLVRHFLSFLLIVIVLTIGKLAHEEYTNHRALQQDLATLNAAQVVLEQLRASMGAEMSERVAQFETASLQQLDKRIQAIQGELQGKQTQGIRIGHAFSVHERVEQYRLDVEIGLLKHELDYAEYFRSLITGSIDLETLRQKHVSTFQVLEANESQQANLKQQHPYTTRLPLTHERKELVKLQEQHRILYDSNESAFKQYELKRKGLEALRASKGVFNTQANQIDSAFQNLKSEIDVRNNKLSSNWVSKLSGPLLEVIQTAILILLGIIFIPIAIKVIFFFVLAPLASRRPPICLLPDTTGAIEGFEAQAQTDSKFSAVSQEIVLDARHELIVHPEYLQSSSIFGKKETKWFLDNKYPLSSLASGMVALTRIHADDRESVVVSATKDPLIEIGLLSMPNGSSIVLQPHCLVGVVKVIGEPLKIERLWRFSSLHAWLTLQFGYFVFHGPAVLIVKGCRGIRLEPSGTGRRVSQAVTIGFSANAQYSTVRCETFASYFFGKQELLNDCFAGEAGFYVYEELPDHGKSRGIMGRGLEGFADSVLKVFGI